MVYRFFKRVLDIVIGLLGVVFLVPTTIILKIAYVCTGDFGPVFFIQSRIGRKGKTFKLMKYRSMHVDAEEELKEMMKKDKNIKAEYEMHKKLKDDPRITKVGGFIRRFSIDEWPQAINILSGSMSVVGNRPYLWSEKKEMGKYFDIIVKTRPGLTGLWQVSGHNDVSFKSRVELEAMYSDIMSFGVDMKILLKTFKAVFKGGDGRSESFCHF